MQIVAAFTVLILVKTVKAVSVSEKKKILAKNCTEVQKVAQTKTEDSHAMLRPQEAQTTFLYTPSDASGHIISDVSWGHRVFQVYQQSDILV